MYFCYYITCYIFLVCVGDGDDDDDNDNEEAKEKSRSFSCQCQCRCCDRGIRNRLYLIENNDENLAEKGTHRQMPGMLEGKNKDGGGGGVLLCRRVMIVLSLCIKSGWFHDLFFFSFVYRQLGSNKQAGTLAVRSFY